MNTYWKDSMLRHSGRLDIAADIIISARHGTNNKEINDKLEKALDLVRFASMTMTVEASQSDKN